MYFRDRWDVCDTVCQMDVSRWNSAQAQAPAKNVVVIIIILDTSSAAYSIGEMLILRNYVNNFTSILPEQVGAVRKRSSVAVHLFKFGVICHLFFSTKGK